MYKVKNILLLYMAFVIKIYKTALSYVKLDWKTCFVTKGCAVAHCLIEESSKLPKVWPLPVNCILQILNTCRQKIWFTFWPSGRNSKHAVSWKPNENCLHFWIWHASFFGP